jgi:hypothetical protein
MPKNKSLLILVIFTFLSFVCIFGGIVLGIQHVTIMDTKIENMADKCEKQEGIFLKNVYWVGKFRKESFICVKKDMVIELQ